MKQDGTYRRIFRKWFEEEPPEDVLNATHEPS
jgi:ABC-type amino acid transport substrate-binding protein